MRITQFLFCVLLAATGCGAYHPTEIFARHSNPIPGWKLVVHHEPSPAIDRDYHDFINKLPQELKDGLGPTAFLEDGTGQHAITIETGDNGTDWTYVLIYNRDDKRIKVVKYISGHYMS